VRFVRIAAIAVVVAVLTAAGGSAKDLICRLPRIGGFEREYEEAKRYTGSNATTLSQVRVYIQARGDTLYCQSNFVTPGYDNPTKLITSRTGLDLPTVMLNLVGESTESGISEPELMQAYPTVPVYADQSVFTSPKFRDFDFGDASQVFHIGSDGTARKAKSIFDGGSRRWVIEYAPSLFAPADIEGIAKLADELKARPLSTSDLRFVSLTKNTSTTKKIAELIPAENRIDFDLSSVDALKQRLAEHRGKTVFFLGHVENGNFVTYDAAGKEIFKIGAKEVQDAALECCQVSVFALGCHSGEATGRNGVLEAFNTVDAVERFHDALGAANFLEFLQRLAGNGEDRLSLIADSSLLSDTSSSAEFAIHRGDLGKAETIRDAPKVATLYYAGWRPAPPPPQTTDTSGTQGDAPVQADTMSSSMSGFSCLFAVVLVAGAVIFIAKKVGGS